MFSFNLFILFLKTYIFFFKRKKSTISLIMIFICSNLLYKSFDSLRFQIKEDKYGNKFTHDLITGKKWKLR